MSLLRASRLGSRKTLPIGGKPVRGKDVLSSAEREELARLRRENRQLKTERDILAKATAWFAGKGDKTSIGSTNS
jgi:transposase